MAIHEYLQRLELYLTHIRLDPLFNFSAEQIVSGLKAERDWVNINIFCIMILRRDPTAQSNVLSQCRLKHCWFTIVDTLETTSETIPDWHSRKHLGRQKVWAAAM
jgi:hypothetical protein